MTKRLKLDPPPSSPTSSPPYMPPHPPPRFSSLPAEIRTAIYNHLFSLPNIQPNRLRTYRSSPSLTLQRPVFAAPTALFLTSRQIGAEARKVFYADNLLALLSIETTALSAPLVWLLKALPEHITWSLLSDDKPQPTGCPVRISYHRGRVAAHEDSRSDDDDNGNDTGAGCQSSAPSSCYSTSAEDWQPLNISGERKETKKSHFIIATASLDRLCREWQYSELTLPSCVFSIRSLPMSGWSLDRLTDMIWRPLSQLGNVKSSHPLWDGPRDGRLFKPVKIVDRTGLFKGIVVPKSERSRMMHKLLRRWGQDLKQRARRRAAERRELAMLRKPEYYGLTGGWAEEEASAFEVGKMAEGLVREMMAEGSEEEKKLDLGYYLEEVAREEQEGGLL